MNHAFQALLDLRTRQLESDCQSAAFRVRTAPTMRAVIQASHVTTPPELRPIRHNFPGYRQLKAAVDRRLEALLDEHLKDLRATATEEEAKALFGQYLSREWQSLRGEHGSLFRRADIEGRRILHQKKPVDTATDIMDTQDTPEQ